MRSVSAPACRVGKAQMVKKYRAFTENDCNSRRAGSRCSTTGLGSSWFHGGRNSTGIWDSMCQA